MDNGQGEIESVSYSPKVGFDNNGSIVVKNRAYRRKWKNRASLEGKKSNKYYTKKKKGKRK